MEARAATHSRLSRAREYLLLIVSGGCVALAFPPVDFVPAAFVGLVPFFYVIRRTRATGFWSAFRPGLVAGLAFFTPLLYWLVFLSSREMDNPLVMSGPLLLLVFLQAFYWGLFSAGAIYVRTRLGAPDWIVLPVFWVAAEQLRSLFVLGFTWGALGHAGAAIPSWVQFASVTGVLGVSFWMAASNALVLEVAVGRPTRRAAAAASLAAILGAAWIHGSGAVRGEHAGESIRVAVIQPNISAETKWDARFKQMSFDVLGDLTLEAASQDPDLVIWPETATPSYLLHEPADLETVAGIARRAGVDILTGCPSLREIGDPGEGFLTQNSAVLVTSTGIVIDTYSKMHLVPFGEFVPFESVFPILERVDFGEADFSPGRERVVFESGEARFSVLICFEAIFPRLVRNFVRDGAELLVNVTNDVWYGRTSMPFQHASMAVMRSIENRRSLARSANSGISLVSDPRGRVLARLGIFERGYLVEDLPVVTDTTFYSRHGDVFAWAVTSGALILVPVSRARTRRTGGTGWGGRASPTGGQGEGHVA
jgi:apolipoprotein N-acyltransferase